MMSIVKKAGKLALAITAGAIWAVAWFIEEHQNKRSRQ